jgi:hypothetical protein
MSKKNEKRPQSQLIDQLREELPPIWDRVKTTQLTGGVVNARTLANLMCRGEGPSGTYAMGRKRIITRESFLEWLRPRIKPNRQSAKGVGKSKGKGAL